MAWNGSDRKIGKEATFDRNCVKNGNAEKSQPQSQCGMLLRKAIVVGIVGLVFGSVAVWWFLSSNSKVKCPSKVFDDRRRTAIKEIASPVASTKNETLTHAQPDSKKKAVHVIGKTPTGKEYVAMKAETNSCGIVTEQYQLTDGKWMQVIQLQTRDSLIFNNDLDLQLAILATTPINQPLPPFPHIEDYEKAFEKAIQTPIIVTKNDNDQVRTMKEAAIAARLQIKDMMDEGYTIEQILSEENSLRQKNIEFRHTFQSEVNDIYRNEGKEAAQKYLESANEKLEQLGILPLTMPGTGPKKRRKSKE